ncbi:hypothetical protein [Candidatus Enterovibrio escicola]|uniref:hypothetical protein n=1 Tax=Candidatus Enterovibrio escicola TaxID=1927127 RepID=UPI0012383679|nr:hypothetical protein [Candidatus Enterovibrio escacola]
MIVMIKLDLFVINIRVLFNAYTGFRFDLIIDAYLNFVGLIFMEKILVERPDIISIMPYILINSAFIEHYIVFESQFFTHHIG